MLERTDVDSIACSLQSTPHIGSGKSMTSKKMALMMRLHFLQGIPKDGYYK